MTRTSFHFQAQMTRISSPLRSSELRRQVVWLPALRMSVSAGLQAFGLDRLVSGEPEGRARRRQPHELRGTTEIPGA